MKQINHNPNEHCKRPSYGEDRIAQQKFGPKPRPVDLLIYLAPFAAVSFVLFLIHGF